MKSPLRRIRLSRFNIRQLLLLTMLIGILLAMIANARRQQPAQAFEAIAFSPDGKRIAIVGEENTQIIRLADKTLLGSVPIGFSGYGGRQVVSFVDDDTVALFSQGNRVAGPACGVYLYSISERKLITKTSIGPWGTVAICPVGFAVRNRANNKLTFQLFAPGAKLVSTNVRTSDDRIWLSESGQWVTCFSDFHQSRGPNMPGPTPSSELLDLTNQKTETFDQPHSDAILAPDGSRILLAGRSGANLLDRKTHAIIWRFELGNRAEDCRFSSDGSLVAIQGTIENNSPNSFRREQFISILNANSGQEILRIDTNDRLRSAFVFSPDGKTIAVADSSDYFRGVQLWDISEGKMTGTVGGSKRIQLLILYPILLLIWTLFWTKSRSAPNQTSDSDTGTEGDVDKDDNKTRSMIGRLFNTGLAVAGFAIICFFSAICFFTMTDAGQFGQLPIWSQSFAVAIVVGACLSGVGLMAWGIHRLGKQ